MPEMPECVRGEVRCTASAVDMGPRGRIATGIPFLDHMLDQLTAHAQLGVSVIVSLRGTEFEPERNYAATLAGAEAPTQLDRDIVELAGEALGGALRSFVPDDAPAQRFLAPLDEGLAEVVLGPAAAEPAVKYNQAPFGVSPPAGRTFVGDLRLDLLAGFWAAVARGMQRDLVVAKVRGRNAHHIVESSFKAFARALRASMDGASPPSVRKRKRAAAAAEAAEATEAAEAAEEEGGAVRRASHHRSTRETSIGVSVCLDVEEGDELNCEVATGLATLDMMVREVAAASGLRLCAKCTGDLYIDDHHTTEDVSIALGQCLNQAFGTKAGCTRMAWASASVGDEVVEVALDLSNRPHFEHNLLFEQEMVGDVSGEMVLHAFDSLATSARVTAHFFHVRGEGAAGGEAEHVVVAACRALGRALGRCVEIDPRRAGATASSKGTLSA